MDPETFEAIWAMVGGGDGNDDAVLGLGEGEAVPVNPDKDDFNMRENLLA